MDETTGLLVFWIVVAARFLVPLIIPLYPIPGILTAAILDAVDQTIFQQFPSISLEGYQGYDKALDVYYLTFAYVSTMRNWTNHFAFKVSRFLFYWRLVGVALFELTGLRALLLIFPNSFEYFFIFYEAYRLRWDPRRMSRRFVIGAAALIWIVIKLPQEYWIHIAQMDLTNTIKEGLFGVPADASWGEIFSTSPVLCLAALLLPILILVGLFWYLARRVPPADYGFSFYTDAHQPAFTTRQVRTALVAQARKVFDPALFEKIVLVTLISITFMQLLPGIVASDLQAAVYLIILVTVNTMVSRWIARRGFGWAYSLWQGLILLAVNTLLFLVYGILMAAFAEPIQFANALFFILLLTLIITFYDRYRKVYLMRFTE